MLFIYAKCKKSLSYFNNEWPSFAKKLEQRKCEIYVCKLNKDLSYVLYKYIDNKFIEQQKTNLQLQTFITNNVTEFPSIYKLKISSGEITSSKKKSI